MSVNGWEVVLVALIAVFVLGPDRMPEYAAKLARGIRKLRVMAEGAKDQLRDQLGPEYDDIDWRQYDPRRYDPRRIVKDALLDPLEDAVAPMREEIGSVRSAARIRAGEPSGAGAAAAADAVAVGVVPGGSSTSPPGAVAERPGAAGPAPRGLQSFDPNAPTRYDPDAT